MDDSPSHSHSLILEHFYSSNDFTTNKCSHSYFFNHSDSKFFNTLNLTFWTTDHNLSRNYHFKYNFIKNSIKNSTNEDEIKIFKLHKEKIEESFEVLSNLKMKDSYLNFLFLNYVFSQPNTLEKLKNNFHFYVFPFFIFVIQMISGKNISTKTNFIVIDFIRKVVNFYYKDNLEKGINADSITEIKIENEKIIINDEYIFESQIQQQRDLIYVLLILLSNNESKLNVELNNFKFSDLKLLYDESYLPSGIILKSHIIKTNKNLSISGKLRFMVLGNSNIIIFK